MILRRFRLRSKVFEPGCPPNHYYVMHLTAQFVDESVEYAIKGRSIQYELIECAIKGKSV